MKVEKIEKMENKYPKFEELDKKNKKTKIGLITALAIAFKSKCVSAISPSQLDIENIQVIPGDMPMYLEPEYIGSRYTTLGYIAMLIITIISSIVVKIKWKNYNLKQKKRAKIILGILLTITVLLILVTLILKSKI